MKKNINRVLIALGLVAVGCTAQARVLFTPFSEYQRLYSHYPLESPVIDNRWWGVDFWGVAQHRTTDAAFLNKETTQTENLAALFFGHSPFIGIEAFTPGSTSPLNPALSFATITPSIDYNEDTVYFGFNFEYGIGCDRAWNVGVRGNLPVKNIEVGLDSCCDLAETINDTTVAVFNRSEQVLDEEGIPQVVHGSCASRLDFLAALPIAANSTQPFVDFDNGAGHVSMAGIDVTDAPPLYTNQNPVTVIDVAAGTIPTSPFSLVVTSSVAGQSVLPSPGNGSGIPFLAADGAGLSNNARARFNQATNYTPLGASAPNQTKLWVVPTVASPGLIPGTLTLVDSAAAIRDAVNSVVASVNTSVIDFFTAAGITFDTQRNAGLGDLKTEFYINRYWNYLWDCKYLNVFGEGIVGVTFPTGKRANNPNRVFWVPTGNNGHYEVKVGAVAGVNPCDWFALKVDGFYSWALRRKEHVAASFKGATVKNLGPAIDADVQWGYFVGDLDCTLLVPKLNNSVGVDLGYQVYVKQRDHVSFGVTSATDLLGVVNVLDHSVLEYRTNQTAHKFKAEIFHQAHNWQLYAGWTHVFAGRNATRDTDWYLGFIAYF